VHAHVQRLVSVVKVVTVLKECNTEKQLSVVKVKVKVKVYFEFKQIQIQVKK
jgi:hypothetical protein